MSGTFLVSALALFLLFPCPSRAQEYPLPPDPALVDEPGCTVVEHAVANVFNAKTKKPDYIYHYRVEPSATYTDGRSAWRLPAEKMSNSTVMRPGAIADVADIHEAGDICLRWTHAVRAAGDAAKEKKK